MDPIHSELRDRQLEPLNTHFGVYISFILGVRLGWCFAGACWCVLPTACSIRDKAVKYLYRVFFSSSSLVFGRSLFPSIYIQRGGLGSTASLFPLAPVLPSLPGLHGNLHGGPTLTRVGPGVGLKRPAHICHDKSYQMRTNLGWMDLGLGNKMVLGWKRRWPSGLRVTNGFFLRKIQKTEGGYNFLESIRVGGRRG